MFRSLKVYFLIGEGEIKMTIEERVLKVVGENLEGDFEVTIKSRLVDDLGADSFNKIMIIAGLEDEFSIEINEDDFVGIETVDDIVNKIKLVFSEKEGE